MAIGDDAVAGGYPTVPNTGEEGRVRYGAREINRTRDFLAQAVRNLTIRRFNTLDDMYSTSGSFTWQEAGIKESPNRYRWTGNIWQLYYGEGDWYPNLSGASPFFIGTDPIIRGRWRVLADRVWLSGQIVFGGAVNFDTSGQHVEISGVPDEGKMSGIGFVGNGLFMPQVGAPVPVILWPRTDRQIFLRTLRTDGIALADGSFSSINGERQSDVLRFEISGIRNY